MLPAVEDGTILLIGATTENPYYHLNAPLLSRCRLFRLSPLKREDVEAIVRRALADRENGLGEYKVELTAGAMEHLLDVAGGDARTALNGLELAVLSTGPAADGIRYITPEIIEDSVQQKIVRYDRDGDEHYNTISLFIKSLRGSDPDAALFYLARMLVAGEDPRFIARRMIIAARGCGERRSPSAGGGGRSAQPWRWWGCRKGGFPWPRLRSIWPRRRSQNAAYLGIDRRWPMWRAGRRGKYPRTCGTLRIRGQRPWATAKATFIPMITPGIMCASSTFPIR